MGINSTSDQRGHVLLIAGDRAVHRRRTQLRPSTNLAALAVVPTPVLLGSTAPADLVHLDGIDSQNALLLRLRAAAATAGPLLVYLSGRLTTDRRADQLHLALTSTTTLNTRYSGFPWDWLRTELRERPPGTSTVLVDLAADKRAWLHLQSPEGRNLAAGLDLYGVVSPPGYTASPDTGSDYTRTLIEQLRQHPERPATAHLHALTVAAAPLPPGTLVLPAAPQIAAVPAARPPVTNVQRLLAGDLSVLPGRRPADTPAAPAPGHGQLPPPPAEYASAPPWRTRPPAAPAPAPAAPAEQPAVQQSRPPAAAPLTARTAAVGVPDQDARGRWVLPGHQRTETAEQPVRAAHPAQPHAPAQPVQAAPAPAPQAPVQQAPQPAPAQQDPRPHIYALAQAGRFSEAAQLAQLWEQQVLHQYGPASPQATQWCEIRADLAKQQGNFLLATQLWVSAGRTRLAHQPPDAPEVAATGKSAHYCWTQISDPRQARECGPELIALLRALPSLDRRHLSLAQQRLEFLNNTSIGS
ncbi:hypothetical protein [Streptomyces mobaraensis]|uniref:Uncharacterized protein n=1 Tax=Streptomyces mobaraensis TaxID=35621 RepID=A0A5N5VXN4_STRMB|nr:hypothetical protein [Streptomyces mobaraensis]KAB7833559.1 hypothetical protein FRZ00_33485 [Streptomyces mobaraensis]